MMTVKELKKKLSRYPDDMEIFVSSDKTEFKYAPLDSVRSDEINFTEEPHGEPLATDMVVILDEQ